jgi:hypothetical protein
MMTGFIPCLYNSFSFTPANLDGGNIICYDIKSRTNNNIVDVGKNVYTELDTPSLPKRLPEPIFITNTPNASDSEESSDADADADAITDASISSDTETIIDLNADAAADNVPSSSVNQIVTFHPNDIRKYINETKCDDSILWSLYIMINGYENFELIDNYYTESNRFKFELIELLRQNKPILKANKLKITALEESLVHKPFITLETLHAVVVCKSISLYIIQDRKYYDVVGGGCDGTTFILEKIKGKYVLYDPPQPLIVKYVTYVKENYWRMESISAPIRPISAYKLQDLIDISTKLGLEVVTKIPGKFGSIGTEKRKTKPELYESICRYV